MPLLYQSGHPTIKDYDKTTLEYILGFPSKEVYESFRETLSNDFFLNNVGDSSFSVDKFFIDVNEGKPEKFMERLKSLIAANFSTKTRTLTEPCLIETIDNPYYFSLNIIAFRLYVLSLHSKPQKR